MLSLPVLNKNSVAVLSTISRTPPQSLFPHLYLSSSQFRPLTAASLRTGFLERGE
jgi:hypothetical protein